MDKKEFLQLVKLDDKIKQLKLKIKYDGIDWTGEIKFFVSGFLDNCGMYFVVDLEKKSLTYQFAQFEEKIGDVKVVALYSEADGLFFIRHIIAYFYFCIMEQHYNSL